MREGDGGLYECQVAALTKLARRLELRVVTPRVQLLGGGAETQGASGELLVGQGAETQGVPGAGELHVSQGGGVGLRCVITGVVDSPAFVTWYFNNKVLCVITLQ